MSANSTNVNPLFGLFIGTNGTGKSTLILKMAKVVKSCIIVPANLHDEKFSAYPSITAQELKEGFTGIRTYYKYDYDIEAIFPYLKNQLFVVDDFKNYISDGQLPKAWQILLSSRRHRKIDIILAAHSPNRVNPAFFDFDPTLVLFKTTRPFTKQLQEKILNYDKLKELHERVNSKAETNPFYYETLTF